LHAVFEPINPMPVIVECLMVAIQLPTLRFELLANNQIARVILLPAAGNGFR